MKTFAHIVNPVKVEPGSDLSRAQPVTFQSLVTAKQICQDPVELLAVGYEQDKLVAPSTFRWLPTLKRSILDFKSFKKSRQLPLISDILTAAYVNSTAQYCIYSNVDIAVQPYFYQAVARLIDQGHDAIVINRRTVGESAGESNGISAYYSDLGTQHPGWDCFVFPREWIARFKLGRVCIGANGIGRIVLLNLQHFSKNFIELKDVHLTFHIGNDGNWREAEQLDYFVENNREVLFQIERLQSLATTRQERKSLALHAKQVKKRIARKPNQLGKFPALDLPGLIEKKPPKIFWLQRLLLRRT